MKLTIISTATVGSFISTSVAMSSASTLPGFPELQLPSSWRGFLNVDPDGVYRAYLFNGTVFDAARLNKDRIDTYFSAIVEAAADGQMVDVAAEKARFSNVDSSS